MRKVTYALTGVTGMVVGCLLERRRVSAAVAYLPVPSLDVQTTVDMGKGGDMVPSPKWDATTRFRDILHFGSSAPSTVRPFDNYIVHYDTKHRNPHWVMEHLTPDNLVDNKVPRSNNFHEDEGVHVFFRATNTDYKGSGFDRGHLAPSANHRLSPDLNSQTFCLSNMSPQVGVGFNRDAWNNLEMYTRFRAKGCPNTWVCSGPLYLPRMNPHDGKSYVNYQVIGNNNVAVPTHFFKVLLVQNKNGSFDLESYVMENACLDSRVPLTAYQVPLDTIERAAGFLIYEKISRASVRLNGMNPQLESFQKKIDAGITFTNKSLPSK